MKIEYEEYNIKTVSENGLSFCMRKRRKFLLNNNDFMLDIIAKLNKQLSNKQLKNDLKGIDNTLSVKVIAKLATALSKKQLGDSLKQLNNLYVQVGTKFKTDKDTRNKLLNEIAQLQKNLTELQLKVNVEKGASQNAINSVISTAKTAQRYADKTSIALDVEVRKEKAVNDIIFIGEKCSKLFSNLSASQKYENLLNSAYSISDKSQLQEVRARISAFTSELKASGLAAESTGRKWGKLIDRAKELFSAASVVRTIFVQAKQAVSTTIDLDKVYTDLVKVNDELNRNDYADYLSRCNQKAQELATTQKALIEGAAEFSKSGYNLSTSDALTEKSTILSNVGDMGASDSAKAIISGVQAYDVVDGYTDVVNKAQALIDKYNEVGNTASITTAEIAQGVQKVGSVFADANSSVDHLIALGAAGNRQYQDADSLFLGLRTSALRIRGASTELEEAGEDIEGVMSVLDNQKSIKALTGVDILEKDQQTIRSIYDIFLDISKVYKDMSDVDQSALLDIIAGKHRASAISATLNNMTEAQEILQNSLNAAGSAQREYDTYLESTEAHLQQFQAKLVETYSTFINGDMISHAADLGSAILDLINKTDLLKHGLIAIATLKIGQGISAAGGAIAGTITQMNILGNALQQIKSLPLDSVLRKATLDDIGESTKALTEKNLKLLLSQKQLNDSDKMIILSKHNLTEEEALSKLETLGLTTATNANTAANTANAGSVNTLKGAFTGLTASVKATWAAMSALQKASIIFAAISTAWSIGSSIINGIKQRTEELRQATQESANAYKESASSIDDYTKRYQELHQALLEAKGNEEETYNIKKQLLDLQTELNDKFGEEYGKINLVTDAYKDQTEAIKAYNKEIANKTLNDIGEKGINDAKSQMLDKKKYNLGMDISLYSDEGLAIQELADKYGIDINSNEGSGTLSLILKTDATTAESTINDFMADVRSLRDNGDFDFTDSFDNVLDYSGSELKRVKDTIEQLGDALQQILIAEIIKDDDELARKYNNALETVEALNEAVLKSEDPFNDENVQKLRQDLEALKATFTTEELENYGYVLYDVFNQADTKLIDFHNELKNNSELQKLADNLRGLDNLDLESLNPGENASFDKLKESADEYKLSLAELIDELVRLGYVQTNATEENAIKELFSSFDNTEIGERLQYINSQFKAGEISCKEYFDALNSEIANVDFSNYTNSLEEANAASAQFFADSTQQAASGLSDLINKFDSGSMSVSEYLEGYLSIANTLSTLTNELQENSASWNQNGTAMSNATSNTLDNTQSALDNAISTIQSYQDSIYSLEQLMTGAVEAGTDEFSAHTQVIAEDLANIVATGGQMADEIASTLGTTTAEIASSMSENVSNQSLAAQAITANTNAAIGDMANSVGELFDTLGNAISNFKVDISFGIKSISMQDVDMGLLGTHKLPKIDFSLEASGDSLSAIGSAISSFGKSVASNMAPQMIELPDFSFKGDNKYTPDASVLDNYNKKLNDMKNAQKGAGKATKDANDALKEQKEAIEAQKEALEAEKEALQEQKEAAAEALEEQIDGIDDVIKGKEKEINLLDDEIDKIKEAREERKRDLDLQKAQYDLARAEDQRPKLVNYMPDAIVI